MPRGKKKGSGKGSTSLWTEFMEVVPHKADGPIEIEKDERYWRNSFYTVYMKLLEPERGMEGAIQLTIRHNDNKAIREWKHFQRIKNELCGEEREAVEVFPPQSMVVDMSNTHHLFVTPVGVSSIFVFEEKLRSEGRSGYGVIHTEEAIPNEG